MRNRSIISTGFGAATLFLFLALPAGAQDGNDVDADKARVVDHWTSERRAAAIPRDLVIDPRGLGYLKGPGAVLEPYGQNLAAGRAVQTAIPSPMAKPGGGGGGTGDTTPPGVSNMDPGAGATIGASYTFAAKVTDTSGIRSVSFKVAKGNSRAQSFSATNTSGDVWSVGLQGFSDGNWSWQVVAKDKAGNTTTTAAVGFTVNTSGTPVGGNTVSNAHWSGGYVQHAAGRLYFEMPYHGSWGGFVCSGTVVTDATSGRSLIMTAAHCVYDDANKVFARNVMFIPDQDGTSGLGTDLNCSNDPMGCWLPSFGAVDVNWTTRTFPDNVAWDYAFYVVSDTGAHAGATAPSSTLDVAAGSLPVSFGSVSLAYTYALGYSYKDDPQFMYCAEDMSTNGSADWWLPHCGLTGGASGGPWVQPMNVSDGSGPIISVNSWGYVDTLGNPLPGMAGAKLVGTSAECVFNAATRQGFPATQPADGAAGTAVTCP